MADPLFIHPAEARRQFCELAAGEITDAMLARGALLIALEEYPKLSIDDYLARLDDLAERVLQRSAVHEPPIFRLGHLHAEMFDVDQYQGDVQSYYDPRNAYLNEVIDLRIGIPITLAIIYLHVATRIGLNAFGVGLPGHYLVKVQFELNEVYVDPFHAGATLTMPEISQLLSRTSEGRIRLNAEHLRSWTPRQTLIRVLANLQNMWGRRGEQRKATAAKERLELLELNE
jgi:regulator of sirC expression with transglutaminase-like and TPR domain